MKTCCAWCGPTSDEDSHGICDDCMKKFFGVKAEEIHAEIATEERQNAREETSSQSDPSLQWLAICQVAGRSRDMGAARNA